MENTVEKKVEQEVEKMIGRHQLEKQLECLYIEKDSNSLINFNIEELIKGLGEDLPTEYSY
jgi:hypothetical protein